MRSTQAEGKDDILRLSEQITQLPVAVQKPQEIPQSVTHEQSGSERDCNGNQHNTRSQGENRGNDEGHCNQQGDQMFLMLGIGASSL